MIKKDFKNTTEMYNYIKENKIGVLEEVVKQNKGMSKVNPSCVNCMSIVTIVNDKDVEVLYGVVKFRVGDHYVDNMGYGVISCPIDLKG